MDTVNKGITVYRDRDGNEISEEEYWMIQKGIQEKKPSDKGKSKSTGKEA